MAAPVETEDDDMAELFSFGSEEAAAHASSTSGTLSQPPLGSGDMIITGGGAGGVTADLSALTQTREERAHSADSFLEMLESEDSSTLHLTNSPTPKSSTQSSLVVDPETREILSWLEDEGKETLKAVSSSVSTSASPIPSKKQATVIPAAAAPVAPTVVALPPQFKTLSEALQSDASTPSQIVQLAQQLQQAEWAAITPEERAQLYCRLLCGGKTLDQVQQSSLADSFVQYQTQEATSAAAVWPFPCEDLATRVVQFVSHNNDNPNNNNNNDNNGNDTDNQRKTVDTVVQELQLLLGFYFQKRITDEDPLVPPLAAALLAVLPNAATASVVLHQLVANRMPVLALQPSERWEACLLLHQELYLLASYHIPLLVYHLDRYLPGWYWPRPPPAPESSILLDGTNSNNSSSSNLGSSSNKEGRENQDSNNSNSNIPVPAKTSRELQNQRGLLPQSWLLSHMAGECGNHNGESYLYLSALSSNAALSNSGLSLDLLLKLWDQTLLILPEKDSLAMRFFLVLAVLEHAAEELLLLTGEQLLQSFQRVTQLTAANSSIHSIPTATKTDSSTSTTGSADNADSDVSTQQPASPIPEDFYSWMARAKQLQEWTPESVWVSLTTAEDRAVQHSLLRRQERAQKELQAKLEAEAEAHRLAQEQKANAARERLTRARLVAFYRKHAPDKESNIDKIMESYSGDYEILDAKLRLKYGEGFNPPIVKKQQPPPQQQQQQQQASPPSSMSRNTNKLLSTMNTGLGVRRGADQILRPASSKDDWGRDDDNSSPSEQVSVLVAASEVLPVICWTKEAAAARGQQRRRRLTDKKQLKFYLVDSRPEEAAAEQGRFPTAVSLSPEAMFDPIRLKENEEMFESLRGAVHIVVMGEGFAALPDLYGHKLTPKLEELMREDESRTNICALFFVKKGFPFVSVLNGGFAAAHSWLVRNGAAHHLSATAVLIDYDQEASLFGQLECLRNATATEKAQRKMQNMLDKSLVAMTRRAQQLERLAKDRENSSNNASNKDGSSGIGSGVVRALFAGRRSESFASLESEELAVADSPVPDSHNKRGTFSRNPLGGVAAAADPSDVMRPSIPLPTSSSPSTLPMGSGGEKSNEEGGDGEEGTTVDLHGSAGAGASSTTSQSTNRFAMFRGAIPEAAAAATAQQASNMFKGLGAALNQSIKATDVSSGAANVLKRNPFARFGGGGGGGGSGAPAAPATSSTAASNTSTAEGSGGGGGWNQLRRAALSRMRSQDSEEESIAFGSTTTTPDPSNEMNVPAEAAGGPGGDNGAEEVAAPPPQVPAAQVQKV